jgi:hypothetical protein
MAALAAYQARLGGLILAAQTGAPPAACPPGLRFTMAVQRAWCEGRAARAAALPLALLPAAARDALLAAYVSSGGGRASVFSAEARRFLAFLAPRLAPGSHAAALCQLQQALLAAEDAALAFPPPPPPQA